MTYELKKFLTERLIDAVEKKRELSIKEFGRSDLYDNENIDEVNRWYSQLKAIIVKNPPTTYLDCIEIIEQNNNVVDIKYDYAEDPKDVKSEISFRVHVINESNI